MDSRPTEGSASGHRGRPLFRSGEDIPTLLLSSTGRCHNSCPKLWSEPLLLASSPSPLRLVESVLRTHSRPSPTSTTHRPRRLTVLSIDGSGAVHLISRGAMLDGLRSVGGGDSVLPFVLQLYGNPSSHLWEDDLGETHEIMQGEGGEQGDPLMPMFHALLPNLSFYRMSASLLSSTTSSSSLSPSGQSRSLTFREDLWDYSRIQIHAGKTQIWKRGGHIPTNHNTLLRAAEIEDPEAQIWFGNLEVPREERGIKVLDSSGNCRFHQVTASVCGRTPSDDS